MGAAALKASQGMGRQVENRILSKRTHGNHCSADAGAARPGYPGRAQHHCTHPVPGVAMCCLGGSACQGFGKTSQAPSGTILHQKEPHVSELRARDSHRAGQAPVRETSGTRLHPQPAQCPGCRSSLHLAAKHRRFSKGSERARVSGRRE